MNAMNKEIKERQSPKVLGEATALRKLVGGLSESRNKLEQELTKAGKEAPPPQKPIPSREKIVALTQAIKKDPENAKLMQKLANLYISYELYEEAVKPLKFAIKLNPRVADFQYLLGYTYYKAQYFQKSLASLSRAVRLNPKFAKAHYYLWMVNELVGIEEAAQKHYQIAIELDPDIENKI